MADIKLSTGSITKLMEGEAVDTPIFQILGLKKVERDGHADVYRLYMSDGVHVHFFGGLAPQLADLVTNGSLSNFTVIRVDRFTLTAIQDRRFIFIHELTILSTAVKDGQTKIGSPVQWTHENANLSKKVEEDDYSQPCVSSKVDLNMTSLKRKATECPVSQVVTKMKRQKAHDEPDWVPIEDITMSQHLWNPHCTIRARVIEKSKIKTYRNAKGDGKLFNFKLVDETGKMQVCCFNEQADQFFDMLENNQVYYFSKFNVRPANGKFNNLDHECEISLKLGSTVQPCLTNTEDIPIHKQTFAFIKIYEIEQKPESSIIDIIGICTNIDGITKVTQRSTGVELTKRDIMLIDNSKKGITITLWGNEALEFTCASNYPVIAIKGAKVSDYYGKSASLLMSSILEINPDIREAHELRAWFDNGGDKEEITSITKAR